MINFKKGDKVLVLDNLRDFRETNIKDGYYYNNSVIDEMLDNIGKIFTVCRDYTFINKDTGVQLDDRMLCEYPPLSLQLVTEKTKEIDLIL